MAKARKGKGRLKGLKDEGNPDGDNLAEILERVHELDPVLDATLRRLQTEIDNDLLSALSSWSTWQREGMKWEPEGDEPGE